jgi:NADH:ubiquinone oxidoreductase subunit 3 (subunit A)
MNNLLLLPPFVFIIILIVSYAVSLGFSRLAFKGHATPGKTEQYACGEDIPVQQLRPDYSQFFPFAIFFTIMHVVALISTTIPKEFTSGYIIAAVYILCALVGLLILFRR